MELHSNGPKLSLVVYKFEYGNAHYFVKTFFIELLIFKTRHQCNMKR